MLIARGPEKRAPPHSSIFFWGVGLIVAICPASEKGPPIYLVPVITKCYVYISILTGKRGERLPSTSPFFKTKDTNFSALISVCAER